jgi:hypothetical protein
MPSDVSRLRGQNDELNNTQTLVANMQPWCSPATDSFPAKWSHWNYRIQELNYVVGDFFDRALYYLLSGYELQAEIEQRAVRV